MLGLLLSTVPFRLGDVGTAVESSTAFVKIHSFKSYTNDFIVTGAESIDLFRTKLNKNVIQMEIRAINEFDMLLYRQYMAVKFCIQSQNDLKSDFNNQLVNR